jgi:hypothetical protein
MAEVEARVRAAAAEEMATMFGGAGAMVGAVPAAASEG